MKALISVTDKTGIADFALGLEKFGYEIVSTGGTLKVLLDAGVKAISIDELTGFPEMLDGRVKTLHPKVHGGILHIRANETHVATVKEHGIDPIDMVVVNLYDFEGTLKSGKPHDEIVENIDIGGPSMIRSAAKNYKDVAVVTDPKDYAEILERLSNKTLDEAFKRKLAYKAFSLTGYYDAMIGRYFAGLENETFPERTAIGLLKESSLRYGENPHQNAAVYEDAMTTSLMTGMTQLHGKELSFNNLNDLNTALELASEFEEPAVAVIKHATPCAAAIGSTIYEAFVRAYEADKMSIFGGIVAMNKEMDAETATAMDEIFLEIVAAPSYSEQALEILKKKKNLRILVINFNNKKSALDVKFTSGKVLIQETDNLNYEKLETVTTTAPTKAQLDDMKFAMIVCKHVKSNAIVIAKDGATVAISGGQTSRIWALQNAIRNNPDKDFTGCSLASDAFFPFDDCVTLSAEHGIAAIMQPGGAGRDQDSIDACNKSGIAMVFTGTRHFKH